MSSLVGTPLLLRHGLRRDRVLATTWLVVLVLVCYASAAATSDLYSSAREQVAAAGAINASPAIVALYGPILDVHSLGELAMTKMTVLYAVFVAVLFMVLVRRHTRVEEESGQAELIGGTAVARDAPLAAAVPRRCWWHCPWGRWWRSPTRSQGCLSPAPWRSVPPGPGSGSCRPVSRPWRAKCRPVPGRARHWPQPGSGFSTPCEPWVTPRLPG